MKKRKEKCWIIVDGNGHAYVDWRCTRVGMIAKHVSDLDPDGQIPSFAYGRSLMPSQAEAWKEQQRKGDRCVKATLIY